MKLKLITILVFLLNLRATQAIEVDGHYIYEKGLGFTAPAVDGGINHANITDKEKGDVYYNTNGTTTGFFGFDGTSWQSLDASAPSDMITTPTATSPVIYSAFITDGISSTTISNEYSNWINGTCSNSSTGIYACNFESGSFSTTPNCTATVEVASGNDRTVTITSISSSAITLEGRNPNTSTLADINFNIICHGVI